MIVRPSSSYQIELPDGIKIQADERVVSYWMDGSPLLLQLSSFLRTGGVAVAAERRLQERIENSPSAWKRLSHPLCADLQVDQASAEQYEEDLVWLHSYFVWPHLTVYATLSGAESDVHTPYTWARRALASLSLVVQ